MTYFFIYCGTGCTCCNDQNHYRGPYASREEAERRIKHFLDPESKFWPLASQYARRGRYSVEEKEVEMLGDGRWIADGRVLDNSLIEVAADGSVAFGDEGELCSDFY